MATPFLFAYGTLRHPAVIGSILGRIPASGEALLLNHVRFRIQDADYPGIFPRQGTEVDGTLFGGITTGEWGVLDRYESDLYERRELQVIRRDRTAVIAGVYVLPPEHESVCTDEAWDLNRYHPPEPPA